MPTLRSLLLCLIIALQALAPLLHAHVGDAPGNGSGLHLAGLTAGTVTYGSVPVTGHREAPAVELSDQFRRPASAVPAPPPESCGKHAQCARRDVLLCVVPPETALPWLQPVFARPSSHAPPVRAA